LRAIDILNRDILIIEKNEKIKKAIKLMLDENIDRLIVIKNGKIYGIVTEYDIFRRLARRQSKRYEPYNTSIASATTIPVDTIEPNTPIKTIAKMFLLNNYSSLPVVENGIPVGIVTKYEVLRFLLEKNPDKFSNIIIKNVMDKARNTIQLFSRITLAESKMLATKYNTLIVKDRNRYVGLLRAITIAKTIFMVKKLNPVQTWDTITRSIYVADLVEKGYTTLKPDDNLYTATKIILNNRQPLIPIIEDGKVSGALSRRHIIRFSLTKGIL